MADASIVIGGKICRVGDRVRYRPNYVSKDDNYHPALEYGHISSIRFRDGSVWVRYDDQHPSQPGRKTPIGDIEVV